jgi:hypothetical protein
MNVVLFDQEGAIWEINVEKTNLGVAQAHHQNFTSLVEGKALD